ncbi:MAG: biopolymer transport protein TolR [Hydrogenophaga sp.]|jgi:biopolymer transport protein TolR
MASTAQRGRGRRRTISEINMVPFIDVMLVLLIIFMVTAPLITPSQIALPSVGQAGRQPDQFVQIVINRDEQVQVKLGNASGDAPSVPMNRLAASVRELQGGEAGNESTPVVISADKNVQYETVVKVMDTLQRAGVTRVGLAVQTSP